MSSISTTQHYYLNTLIYMSKLNRSIKQSIRLPRAGFKPNTAETFIELGSCLGKGDVVVVRECDVTLDDFGRRDVKPVE